MSSSKLQIDVNFIQITYELGIQEQELKKVERI